MVMSKNTKVTLSVFIANNYDMAVYLNIHDSLRHISDPFNWKLCPKQLYLPALLFKPE